MRKFAINFAMMRIDWREGKEIGYRIKQTPLLIFIVDLQIVAALLSIRTENDVNGGCTSSAQPVMFVVGDSESTKT
jgi:hypothetical protein